MKQLKVLSAVGLLAIAGTAQAGVSSTVTATNDYDFRGYSQSATDPALQASLDFSTDFGWYIGAWASNIDFGPGVDADIELDLYTGFSGEAGPIGWDAGIVYYTYPSESDLNFPEIYGSISAGPFSAKLYYSNDFAALDESAFYLDTGLEFELPANFSIMAHVGYSTGDAIDLVAGDDYMDYSIGVGYSAGNFDFALKYVDNNADFEITDDYFNNEGRVIFTVSTTFPWE